MSMISELVEELIDNADLYTKELHDIMYRAAETIVMLSESDSISRQSAIDEVKRLHDVAWTNWKETKIPANMMIDALKNLPSTNVPDICVGEWERDR